jgi:hypothetical protein
VTRPDTRFPTKQAAAIAPPSAGRAALVRTNSAVIATVASSAASAPSSRGPSSPPPSHAMSGGDTRLYPCGDTPPYQPKSRGAQPCAAKKSARAIWADRSVPTGGAARNAAQRATATATGARMTLTILDFSGGTRDIST